MSKNKCRRGSLQKVDLGFVCSALQPHQEPRASCVAERSSYSFGDKEGYVRSVIRHRSLGFYGRHAVRRGNNGPAPSPLGLTSCLLCRSAQVVGQSVRFPQHGIHEFIASPRRAAAHRLPARRHRPACRTRGHCCCRLACLLEVRSSSLLRPVELAGGRMRDVRQIRVREQRWRGRGLEVARSRCGLAGARILRFEAGSQLLSCFDGRAHTPRPFLINHASGACMGHLLCNIKRCMPLWCPAHIAASGNCGQDQPGAPAQTQTCKFEQGRHWGGGPRHRISRLAPASSSIRTASSCPYHAA